MTKPFTMLTSAAVWSPGSLSDLIHLCCLFVYHFDRITKPFTMLTIGTLIAQAVSGPVAAGFLAMNGIGGLHGWQWLFLLEGLPTVFMSAIVWCYLADSPTTAAWLTESEKKALEADVSRVQAGFMAWGIRV